MKLMDRFGFLPYLYVGHTKILMVMMDAVAFVCFYNLEMEVKSTKQIDTYFVLMLPSTSTTMRSKCPDVLLPADSKCFVSLKYHPTQAVSGTEQPWSVPHCEPTWASSSILMCLLGIR